MVKMKKVAGAMDYNFQQIQVVFNKVEKILKEISEKQANINTRLKKVEGKLKIK